MVGNIIYLVLIGIIDFLYGKKFLTGGRKDALKILMLNLVCILILLLGKRVRRWVESHKGVRTVFGIAWWATAPPVAFFALQMLCGPSLIVRPNFLRVNLIFCFLILLILTAVIGDMMVAQISYSAAFSVFGLVCYYLNVFRSKPLTAFDLYSIGTALDVSGSYTYDIGPRAAKILLAMVAYLILTGCVQTLAFGGRVFRKKPHEKKHVLRTAGIRAVSAIAGCLAFFLVTRNVLLNGMITNVGGAFFNMNKSYQRRGAVAMFVLETTLMREKVPEGYSAQVTAEKLADFMDIADDADLVQPENVIVIMNETFSDLESLFGLQANQEVLPTLHSLSGNAVTGNAYVPVFGGSTADTEYEFLTGTARAFLPEGTVAYQAYVRNPEYSIASILKQQGYDTVAMHPNKPSAWNRKTVYEEMGFDHFLSSKNWGEEVEKLRGYATDESVYRRLEDLYEDKEQGQKLFTFCVTIQNHGGYAKTDENFTQDITLNYSQPYPQAEQYLSLVHLADKSLKGLLDHFEQVDEPTMIVFFGDHQPFIEDGLYGELTGTPLSEWTSEMMQERYITPYIIWTNYDISQTGLSEDELAGPDVSVNYLGAEMLRAIGANQTPYLYVTDQLKTEIPVIGIGEVKDKDGTWHPQTDIPAEYQDDWTLYKYLAYNRTFDRKNLLAGAFDSTDGE